MAETSKKTTRVAKKNTTPKASKVPTAKAVAAASAVAETKGQPAPVAVKTAVIPPAPVKPTVTFAPTPAPAKPAAALAAPKATVISRSERQRMVEQAAYFRAEKHGFQGDSSQHWSEAEAEIDADLKRRGVKVV